MCNYLLIHRIILYETAFKTNAKILTPIISRPIVSVYQSGKCERVPRAKEAATKVE